MKALLGIMHPRRLPFFLESMQRIDYMDIVLAKNYPLIDAQNQIRKFFLENDYDVLVFTSDDVELPYEAPRQIIEDIEGTGHKIITGWSRCRPDRQEANITLEPISNIDKRRDVPIYYEAYRFMKLREIDAMLQQGKTLIPVWFVGWSLTGMTREIVGLWQPRGWYFQHTEPYHYVLNGRKGCWCSSDLWFSYNIWKLGIPKYADLRVKVPHNPPLLGKTNPEKAKMLLVGKEPSKVEFIKAKKRLG
jgi:hypothetical protein